MSIWNVISDIILFRWLFRNLNWNEQSGNTFEQLKPTKKKPNHEEIDSTEFSFNRSSTNFSRGSKYDNRHFYDYNNSGYSHSFDNFHEEQDDYDMMDDF